jgi:hypothetical protein
VSKTISKPDANPILALLLTCAPLFKVVSYIDKEATCKNA